MTKNISCSRVINEFGLGAKMLLIVTKIPRNSNCGDYDLRYVCYPLSSEKKIIIKSISNM